MSSIDNTSSSPPQDIFWETRKFLSDLKDKGSATSNLTNEILAKLETEGKLIKITNPSDFGGEKKKYIAILNSNPNTVFKVNSEMYDAFSGVRNYYIDSPNTTTGSKNTPINSITIKNNTVTVWDVPSKDYVSIFGVDSYAPKSARNVGFGPNEYGGRRKSKKSKKSRKSRKSKKSRKQRRSKRRRN